MFSIGQIWNNLSTTNKILAVGVTVTGGAATVAAVHLAFRHFAGISGQNPGGNISVERDSEQVALMIREHGLLSLRQAARQENQLAQDLVTAWNETAATPGCSRAEGQALLARLEDILNQARTNGSQVAQRVCDTLESLRNGNSGAQELADMEEQALLGDAEAQTALGYIDLTEARVVLDCTRRYTRRLEQEVRRNDPQAQRRLGMILMSGSNGIVQDWQAGVRLVQQAAVQGDLEASYTLAGWLRRGGPVPQDLNHARALYEQIARGGIVRAHYDFASMLYQGLGGLRDFNGAREHYTIAANAGIIPAITNLAIMFDRGEGGSSDEARAREFYEVAVNAGDAKAMYYYGHMLQSSANAEEQDRGVQLWQQAAAAGNSMARMQLNLMASTDTSHPDE